MNVSCTISTICNPNIDGLLFSAYLDRTRVGYAIISNEEERIFILSKILVYPEFRNNHIGTILMNNIISFLKELGADHLLINYGKDIDLVRFEIFLSKFDWIHTQKMCTFYRIDLNLTISTYLEKYFGNRKNTDFSIKFYNQLEKEYIDSIIKYADENVSDFSNPLRNNKRIIPELSVFAFDVQNNILGWIIAEDLNKDEISITLSYVTEEYRSCGLGLLLQYEIFKQAERLHVKEKYKYGTFESFEDDKNVEKLYNLLFGKSIVSKNPCYRRIMKL